MDIKFYKSFQFIATFFFVDSKRCDFYRDNLPHLIASNIADLEEKFNGCITIDLSDKGSFLEYNINDFNKFFLVDISYIKLLELLCIKSLDQNYIFEFLKINFSGYIYYKLVLFFHLIFDNIKDSYWKEKYINSFDDENLKIFFHFYNNAFIWKKPKNIKISIAYLNKLIDEYPYFISFRHFKVRQLFEYYYRVEVGKQRFNYLISTKKGKKFLLDSSVINQCFNILDQCDEIIPNNYVTYLFRGKLNLHLLIEKGIYQLQKALIYQKRVYDEDIFSWVGVYYLQIGNFSRAEYYVLNGLYTDVSLYKHLGKILYFYKLKDDFESYYMYFQDKYFTGEVLLLLDGIYYRYSGNTLLRINIPSDINDITKYLNFGLDGYIDRNKKFNSKKLFMFDVFRNISKKYYKHWGFSNDNKVYFVIDPPSI